ncbi:PKD domain protein [Synechococcus sp. PCC 7335]|uniref:PKD domain-containing protein n=1 Tax=Synechococcus sp. (strain ATCC 29403 / PCC 7335) TaxID=91464 RepID=UPI00017ECA89|nr:PKD domain-containing protein [Synechococcus sp. PCC 7335]EDX87428.1 PKD domain protein [Synechococcus sp. PCC 7335]
MTLSIVPVKSSVFVEEGNSIGLTVKTDGIEDDRTLTCEWDFGDGSSSIQGAMVIHRYHLAGQYPLTLIARDDKGTVSIIKRTAVVEMVPLVINSLVSYVIDHSKGIVAFEATAKASSNDLSGSNQIIDNSGDNCPVISRVSTYVWNFGDGSCSALGQKAIHKFNQSGTYFVSLIVSSPSGATATQVHKVTLDGVIQDSPIKNNKEVLEGYPITFNSPYKDNRILETHSIYWDFGDGTIVKNKVAPQHVYRKAGNYTVSLAITNKKGETSTNQIPVEVVSGAVEIRSLSASNLSRGLAPTKLTAFVDAPNKGALNYSWNFGDGSQKSYIKQPKSNAGKGDTVHHTYSRDGVYTVTLEVTNETGSRAVEVIPITVDSILQIESIAYPSTLIVGRAASFSTVASTRQKEGLIYQWMFERTDRNASRNASQRASENTGVSKGINTDENTQRKIGQVVSSTFLEAGAWSVTLGVSDGSKTVTEGFTIFVTQTELTISIQTKAHVLAKQHTEFVGSVNNSTNQSASSADLSTIEWDFGDGTKIKSKTLAVSHQYLHPGNYTTILRVIDTYGITATSTVSVNVIELPLILIARGKVVARLAANESVDGISGGVDKELTDRIEASLTIQPANNFYLYRGQMLRVEGKALIVVPKIDSRTMTIDTVDAIDAIASAEEDRQPLENQMRGARQRNIYPATISSVQANDSVQYQERGVVSIEVPQHRDLINNLLLQTSPIGYSPIQLDIRKYREQIQTTLGWSEIFLAGETADRPTVIEIQRGPLIVPGGVTLENMVIVVNRGNIVLRENYYTIDNLTLVAKDGGVELDDISAKAIKIFASKAIQTTKRSRFRGNSILASRQSIVFNGATVDATDCLKIVTQKRICFNASGAARSRILAKADVELYPNTTLEGSVHSLGNVIFNEGATLRAATHLTIVESHKTVTLPTSDFANGLNIRLPQGVDDAHHTIFVVDIPPDSSGTLQLADGSVLFPGKQLTCAELEQTSFFPTPAAAEDTSCFVYAIEDSWDTPINQTINICFESPATFADQADGLTAQPSTLWPPEHQMVEVKIESLVTIESDFTVTLESIACSEPIGSRIEGGSDYDYEIIEDDRILLRAAKLRNGTARVYQLTYRMEDKLGNVEYSRLDVPVALSLEMYQIQGYA